jgi:murein DD-endopeptidase MepM/ murein hydrolase activator NlpD
VAVGGVLATGFAPRASAETFDEPSASVPPVRASSSHVATAPLRPDQWLRAEERAIEAQRHQTRAQAVRKAADSDRAAMQTKTSCVVPTSNYTLTASFGEVGAYWSSGRHTGQDFAAAVGTPIVAACDGRIAFAGWDGPYGNKVIITHADGTQTMYAHMLRLAVSAGPVDAGQTIGYLGATGNVTGPHLHFEALVNGVAVDPVAWLRCHGVSP